MPKDLIYFSFLQLSSTIKPIVLQLFLHNTRTFSVLFLFRFMSSWHFYFLAGVVNIPESLLPLLHIKLSLVISQVQLQGTGTWKRSKWGLYVNNKSSEIPQRAGIILKSPWMGFIVFKNVGFISYSDVGFGLSVYKPHFPIKNKKAKIQNDI